MPPRPKPPDNRRFNVGDHVLVSLTAGRIVDATIRAIVPHPDGDRLQVDYEKDQTALVHLWQVHRAN